MAIRVRYVDGKPIALCAAEHPEQEGDQYLDDAVDHALREKFKADCHSEGWLLGDEVARLTEERDEARDDLAVILRFAEDHAQEVRNWIARMSPKSFRYSLDNADTRKSLASFRADAERLRAEVERLRGLLREARGYVCDSVCSTPASAWEGGGLGDRILLDRIDAALSGKPAPAEPEEDIHDFTADAPGEDRDGGIDPLAGHLSAEPEEDTP